MYIQFNIKENNKKNMLFSFFTDSNDINSIFSLIDFLVLIISIIFGFIIFTFLCFYSVLRTAMTFLIMNMIVMSIVYSGRILFNTYNTKFQFLLFISSTFSITITLCVLLFLSYNKVIKQKCHDKGYCYTKFIFFFICDVFPFIIGIVFYHTKVYDNINTVLYIYTGFLIIMMLINLILGIRMISIINTEETKRTRQYPIRISLFILSHFLSNINMLIIGVLTIFDNSIQFELYIELADLFTNLQAIFYSISFIFYPRVISVIKGLIIKKKANESLTGQSTYHSVFDIENSNLQSITQTIYD